MSMQQITDSKIHHQYGYCRNSDGYYRIKSCLFDKYVPLRQAISEIKSDKTLFSDLSCYRHFNKKTINQIQSDLYENKKLGDVKVIGLVGYGQTALVFETESGDILKITSRDHFLGRKPEKFDMPIKIHDKLTPKSFCHYYIEEKTNYVCSFNDSLSSILEEIKNLGYKTVDIGLHQFGRTSDNKIVLLDPECVRKKGILGLLKYKLAKIKSYLILLKH